MIIADENIDQWLIDEVIKAGFEVYSIREKHAGISDEEVIQLAISKNAALLTEDKDFGELVFSYGIQACSVIFIRYSKTERKIIVQNIVRVLKHAAKQNKHAFYTITAQKVRARYF